LGFGVKVIKRICMNDNGGFDIMAVKSTETSTPKNEEKNVTKKAVSAKKAETVKTEDVKKETEKKASEKKAPEKKAPAKKKTTTKKDIVTTVYVEYMGKQVAVKDAIPQIKKIWQKAGNKVGDIKDIALYAKPEDDKIYFVINGDFSGAVDL